MGRMRHKVNFQGSRGGLNSVFLLEDMLAYRYFSDIPLSEYGSKPFYGGGCARIKIHAGKVKNSCPYRHSPYVGSQAPSNKLTASRQRTGITPPHSEAKFLWEKYKHVVRMSGGRPEARGLLD